METVHYQYCDYNVHNKKFVNVIFLPEEFTMEIEEICEPNFPARETEETRNLLRKASFSNMEFVNAIFLQQKFTARRLSQ